MRTINKTFKTLYFLQSDFHKDRVSYIYHDGVKHREDKMLRENAEKLMTPDNTKEGIKFGFPIWKVKL